jgi:hypothetical protein
LGDVDELLHLSASIKIDQQHPVFEDGATDSFSTALRINILNHYRVAGPAGF